MSAAHLDGVDAYYEERGTGHALLLIHGNGGNASTWLILVILIGGRQDKCVPRLRWRSPSVGSRRRPTRPDSTQSDAAFARLLDCARGTR